MMIQQDIRLSNKIIEIGMGTDDDAVEEELCFGWIDSTVTVSRTHPGSDTFPRCKDSRLPRNTLGDRHVLAHHLQFHYNWL